MPREVAPSVRIPHREKVEDIPVRTFDSIGVVGAKGQTGRLYMETITAAFSDMPITAIDPNDREINFAGKVDLFTDVTTAFKQGKRPEALILATANPTRPLLEEIAANLDNKPLTLILPQNGIAVVSEAQEIFKGKPVTLIRANLFSSSINKDDGTVFYNKEKLRIGLAYVPGAQGEVFDAAKEAEMQKAAAMFRKAGFDAITFGKDYENLEWTKLVLNAMVSTGGVTGFTPEETCNDPELYELEMKAASDRLKILAKAGIEYQKIKWGGADLLPLLTVPGTKTLARKVERLKKKIIKQIVEGRDNKPSGAWLNIMAGKDTELTYYHQPFIDMGKEHGLHSYVDEAILAVAATHIPDGSINDLRERTLEQRKQLLLDTYRALVSKAHQKAA